jgi:hypothetical protein
MAERRFEVVPDDPPAADKPDGSGPANDAGASLLFLGLQTVGKRFVAALADLFCLVTVSLAFFLWYITPSPNVLQVVSLSIFALFVLAANWIVRSRKT